VSKPPAKRTGNSRTDALSGEVALRAHLDQSGLTVGGRSRALVAFDRLLGGLIGIPAEGVEWVRHLIERGKQDWEHRRDIQTQVATAETLDPALRGLVQSAVQRLVADEIRNQANRAAVWIEAQESLLSSPEQPEVVTESDQPIDEDWLNVFASLAQRASREGMQKLWGRILAGKYAGQSRSLYRRSASCQRWTAR
jgi:Protein of unknown function (DUF2806)